MKFNTRSREVLIEVTVTKVGVTGKIPTGLTSLTEATVEEATVAEATKVDTTEVETTEAETTATVSIAVEGTMTVDCIMTGVTTEESKIDLVTTFV